MPQRSPEQNYNDAFSLCGPSLMCTETLLAITDTELCPACRALFFHLDNYAIQCILLYCPSSDSTYLCNLSFSLCGARGLCVFLMRSGICIALGVSDSKLEGF
jgi:hypothetical protein